MDEQQEQYEHTREFISGRKSSHKHSNKDLGHLQLKFRALFCSVSDSNSNNFLTATGRI